MSHDDATDAVMLCPRCDARELRPRAVSGIEIDVCPHCRGTWLDPGELEALTTDAIVRAGYTAALIDDGDADLLTATSRRPRPMRRAPRP